MEKKKVHYVEANGLRFAYLSEGSTDAPLALCVHGFPDSAYSWRHLTPELVQAGFRVVAPWQRGYAPTAVPDDGQYMMGALTTDVIALHEALGGDQRSVLIGHDFGASAAYGAAALAPNRWSRVVVMAIPPPSTSGEKMMTYDQLRRSWYAYFFQNPMADKIVASGDLAFIERLWRDWSPDFDPAEEMHEVRKSLHSPAHVTAALSYYRSMFGAIPPSDTFAEAQKAVAAPTPHPALYLHGVDDACMGIELAQGAEKAFPNAASQVVRVEDAGHFLHLDRPKFVNEKIIAFLRATE